MASNRATILRQRQEAVLKLMNGDFKEAEPTIREALEQTSEQRNAETWMWTQRLAECLLGQGKLNEAEPLAQKALKGFRAFGPDDEDMLDCKYMLAEIYQGQRKHSEAGDLAQSALEGLLDNMKRGPEHPTTLKCRGLLAISLKTQFKIKEGEALAKENMEILQSVIQKAETTEAQGSRRLAMSERRALEKVEFFGEKVLGDNTNKLSEKVLGDNTNKPKRTATIETVSTNMPDDDIDASSRVSSQQSSRAPSKNVPVLVTG